MAQQGEQLRRRAIAAAVPAAMPPRFADDHRQRAPAGDFLLDKSSAAKGRHAAAPLSPPHAQLGSVYGQGYELRGGQRLAA